MPQGGPPLQAGVLLLPHPDLHSVLHVGHRVLGVLLAGPERRACAGLARGHHSPHHGNADLRYTPLNNHLISNARMTVNLLDKNLKLSGESLLGYINTLSDF